MQNLSNSEKAYKTIKHMIAERELLPRQQLVETALAERCGVSRTPIREAIRRLERDGLVDFVHNRGAFVQAISREEVIMCYEEAAALESMAMYICVEKMLLGKITLNDIKHLEDTVEKMENLMSSSQAREWLDADEQYHSGIVVLSGNSFINQHRNQLLAKLGLASWYRAESNKGFREVSNLHHRKQLDALIRKDKQTASELAREHRINTRNALYSDISIN